MSVPGPDPLHSPFAPHEIAEDRAAILAWLERYLVTGVAPEAPRLHHGPRIRSDGGREPIGESARAWALLHGKDVGCPFWSAEAVASLRRCAEEHPRLRPSSLLREARSWRRGFDRLQHEHVFPRAEWRRLMEPQVGAFEPGRGLPLAELLERYCAGCVVTEREHRSLGRAGVLANPWLRYARAGVRLAPNPAWTDPHRSWIAAAGLVEPEALRRSA